MSVRFSRRDVLTGALATSLTLPLSSQTWAALAEETESFLELVNLHTGEAVNVIYRNASGLITGALRRLEHVLRDHRADESHPIDPRLFVQLTDLARAAGREPRYEIISGYRAPRTNARLAAQSNGVATRSLHMEGRALDVRLKGCTCLRLSELALELGRGGVGYYARSNFVHIDTGRVRTWKG